MSRSNNSCRGEKRCSYYAYYYFRYQTEIENARRLGNKKALSRGLAVFSLYIIIFAAFGFAFWYVSQKRKLFKTENVVVEGSPDFLYMKN